MSRRCLLFVLGLALAGCGARTSPADPLVGAWRSGEFETEYPSAMMRARTVVELRFEATGRAEYIIVRRYDLDQPSMYRGCTWIERHAQLQWRRDRDATVGQLHIVPVRDARYTSERAGCADPAQNRGPVSAPEDFIAFGTSVYGAVVRENILELTLFGPVGSAPSVREYTRIG